MSPRLGGWFESNSGRTSANVFRTSSGDGGAVRRQGVATVSPSAPRRHPPALARRAVGRWRRGRSRLPSGRCSRVGSGGTRPASGASARWRDGRAPGRPALCAAASPAPSVPASRARHRGPGKVHAEQALSGLSEFAESGLTKRVGRSLIGPLASMLVPGVRPGRLPNKGLSGPEYAGTLNLHWLGSKHGPAPLGCRGGFRQPWE